MQICADGKITEHADQEQNPDRIPGIIAPHRAKHFRTQHGFTGTDLLDQSDLGNSTYGPEYPQHPRVGDAQITGHERCAGRTDSQNVDPRRRRFEIPHPVGEGADTDIEHEENTHQGFDPARGFHRPDQLGTTAEHFQKRCHGRKEHRQIGRCQVQPLITFVFGELQPESLFRLFAFPGSGCFMA